MEIVDRIYASSPILLQQTIVATFGLWWHRRRFGSHFHKLVSEFKTRERWKAEQFHSYQEEQLRRLLFAAWNSPYYREILTEAKITRDMEPFDALRHLPILSKETLRKKARDMLTQGRMPRGTIVFQSSGTTGTPTEIFYPPQFHALELAVPEARNLHWANVSHRDRRVMFGVRKVCNFNQMKPPFWRFSPAENMAYASIYHLSPRFLPHYLEFLRSYRPTIVMGYPSSLNSIASYALESNDLPAPAKAVFTTSETVNLAARERIEKAFQCQIYDRYCAVEMCLFASQCEYARYHVCPETGIIEIVDSDGKEVPPGEMGQVICTGLQNTLQPLIRYRIGDVARWAVDQNCPCRRAMPILESIEGRFEDVCHTPDGRELLRFDTVFKGIDNIREAQVVQEKIDSFAVYVVPTDGFGKKEIEAIKHNMRLHVGSICTEVKPTALIPRTGSGKFRAVICNLSSEEKSNIRRIRPPINSG